MQVFLVLFMSLSNQVATQERAGSVRLNAHDEEHIKASLNSVGMWEHRDKRIGSLSGGQKQRAVIARMFASDPDIFILDEPTTGMDAGTKNEFYELMHHSAHHPWQGCFDDYSRS